MLGRLVVVREKGRTCVEREQIAGLPLMRGTLYVPEGLHPWRRRWRIRRLKRLFAEQGLRCLILPDGPDTDEFSEFGRVSVLGFYRGIADLLAISCLREHGIEPRRAAVALSASRLCPELAAAAERLVPQVRAVAVDIPGEGEQYAARIHRVYGIPVTPAAGADVTVVFGPDRARWGRVLELTEEKCSLCGLTVTAPGLELPAGYEQQMLAALWERGLLDRDTLQICRARS